MLTRKKYKSLLSDQFTPEQFARSLLSYDIISFDVFDTLIFRPFSSPSDLFFLLGARLSYPDFQRIRGELEWRARKKKHKEAGHYEVSLSEIYSVIADETGLPKESTMEMEFALEKEYCFANPYMLRVVEELRRLGKKMIIITDMYLGGGQIKELLKRCSYGLFDAYYSSCDYGMSKAKGDMYDLVKKKHGGRKSYVHVGDNLISDVQNAVKHGIRYKYYPNVNNIGNTYRTHEMSVITGGIYRGIVNAHLYSGLEKYSKAYEYGFICGGLFVTGYCQFIHRYVNAHDVDKILFLARDGDILHKAYRKLYPDETERCAYVYWSRLAAVKMSARYFKYDFFRRFLFHKVNQGYTMREIFRGMELQTFLNSCCRELKITEKTILTSRNVKDVKSFLISVWDEVVQTYDDQLQAGKQYYEPILAGCKKAVAVDIGWAGSGAISLNYIVNKIWNLECEITGIIAGTNSFHNVEQNFSETFLKDKKLISYLYSQEMNRDLWKFHNPGKNHNLYWEILLDAPAGSLKGFYLNHKGETVCRFKKPRADMEGVKEIQRGILDFVKMYSKYIDRLGNFAEISGSDAYAPMRFMMEKKNRAFMKEMEKYMDEVNI